MRFRSIAPLLLVLAVAMLGATSYVAAADESTTAPAEPEVVTTETETETEAEAPLAEDPFLDQSLITITPVHDVYCPCQVGVDCCGDPGVDIQCGKRRECVCNAQDECILLHVHPPK